MNLKNILNHLLPVNIRYKNKQMKIFINNNRITIQYSDRYPAFISLKLDVNEFLEILISTKSKKKNNILNDLNIHIIRKNIPLMEYVKIRNYLNNFIKSIHLSNLVFEYLFN